MTQERTPRTEAGQTLFSDWLERRRDHPPNTQRALDLILAIEAEAWAATGEGLDPERLARAIKEQREMLLPSGKPVDEVIERANAACIAARYMRLMEQDR